MGAPQQSLLIQRIQVSPHGNDRDAQLFAQSFHRNPSGLLQPGENSGKADLLFILGRVFKLWLSIRADSWPWGPFTLHNNAVPVHRSRFRKRNSSGPTFCDSAQNESAVEAYYSEFQRLQKIVSSNKCFPITSKSFYFADVNHSFSHFALK